MRIAIATTVLVIVSTAATGGTAPLADKLPAGSKAYIGWAGRNEAFDAAKFGQLVQDPGLAKIVASLQELAREEARGNPEDIVYINHAFELGRMIWQRPIAISLLGTRKTRTGDKAEIVMLIDLGNQQAAFKRHLDGLLREAPLSDGTVDDQAVRILSTPAGLVRFGYKGNLMFVALGEGVVEKLLAVTPQTSLAASPTFKAALKDVDGDHLQLVSYTDYAAYLKQAKRLIRSVEQERGGSGARPAETMNRMLETSGVTNTKTVVSATRVDGKLFYGKARVVTAAPHKGLLGAFARRPITDADLAGIPADAQLAVVAKISLQDVYKSIDEMVTAIEPQENLMQEFHRVFTEATGVSFADDILAHVGDTWTLASAPSLGGQLTGTVLSVEVRDAGQIQATIERIKTKLIPPPPAPEPDEDRWDSLRRLRRMRPVVEMTTVDDISVQYLRTHAIPNPVCPAWAVHKGRLYVAPYPQVLAAAIRAKGKPLASSPTFQAFRKRVSPRASTLVYVDAPNLGRQAYPSLLMLWTLAANAAGAEGATMDPNWLPPLSALEGYLSPEIYAASSDDGGFTFESSGAILMPDRGMLAAVGAMAYAIAGPIVEKAQAQVKRNQAMSHVRTIANGAIEYEITMGRRPKDLAALVDAGMFPTFILRSPSGQGPPPKVQQGKLIGETDYILIHYTGDKKIRDGNVLLVYEKPANWDNKGTIVGMANGSVQWVDMARFNKMKAAAAKLIQAGATEKAPPATKP